MKDKISNLLNEALERIGEDRLTEELLKLSSIDTNAGEQTLTIIANEGIHHLPQSLARGEVLVASKGSLDFSSNESIDREFTKILKNIAQKLKEREWKKIYLIPFGPSNLSMLIKLLVYRVTHIETIDLFYIDSQYREVHIKLRQLITES